MEFFDTGLGKAVAAAWIVLTSALFFLDHEYRDRTRFFYWCLWVTFGGPMLIGIFGPAALGILMIVRQMI